MLSVELISQLSDKHLQDLWNLYQTRRWVQGLQVFDMHALIEGSDVIVAFCDTNTQQLVGFARVLTDFACRAVIFDVMVQKSHRYQGLGRSLMEAIWQHPDLQSVEKFALFCLPELVPFYQKCGFTVAPGNMLFLSRSREIVLY